MTGPLPATALVLPDEDGLVPGALDAWLADAAGLDVAAEASEVLGRNVVPWWRDPLNLNDPVAAALATVVTGVAGAAVLARRGLQPAAYAGHGVGEYAALVAAGALRLDQVVALVDWRAEMLAHAQRPCCAGMAAVVGPGAAEVAHRVVADLGPTDGLTAAGGLAIACYDGPRRTVLSGLCDELARAREAVVGAGLELVRLPRRPACHGPMVQSISERLAAPLADLDWSVPVAPVLPNVDGRPSRDPDHLAGCLRRHLTSPVQWERTCRALADAGVTRVVEVGAVATLGPLIEQVRPDLSVQLTTGPGTPGPTTRPEPALTGPAPTRGER